MIETFRAIGYSLETAIADIIDNSISAQAKNIYINRIWRGGKSVITIKVDGLGMNFCINESKIQEQSTESINGGVKMKGKWVQMKKVKLTDDDKNVLILEQIRKMLNFNQDRNIFNR
jgi:hypothetical protein